MRVSVLKSGMWSTLQDEGRKGLQGKGIPVGGALDRHSYQMVNTLLENDLNTPVIEITIIGPKLHFDHTCTIAICGSDLNPQLDGVSVELNQAIKVSADQTLSFGRSQYGCRSYLGIAGAWHVAEWLGSVSPLLYGVDHSLQVGILKKNQIIEITPRSVSNQVQLNYNFNLDSTIIKGYKGPEFDLFDKVEISNLLINHYTISQDSNRMGYRLKGELLKIPQGELISSATIPGTVQITNDGLPIILLNDSQTTGGYPRILQLTQESINLLAHKKGGDEVSFKLIDYDV